MIKYQKWNALVVIASLIMIQGCDSYSSSNSNRDYSKPYNHDINSVKKSIQEAIDESEEALKQIESTSYTLQRRRVQRSDEWERGYSYGWDEGYDDAVNGNGAWASYDDSGKGGDFLDGYESGYIDGYESGKYDRDKDAEEIEEL